MSVNIVQISHSLTRQYKVNYINILELALPQIQNNQWHIPHVCLSVYLSIYLTLVELWKDWKQPRCITAGEWLDKHNLWYWFHVEVESNDVECTGDHRTLRQS
jgi:hypothetical protein